jgi:hypothetical protein
LGSSEVTARIERIRLCGLLLYQLSYAEPCEPGGWTRTSGLKREVTESYTTPSKTPPGIERERSSLARRNRPLHHGSRTRNVGRKEARPVFFTKEVTNRYTMPTNDYRQIA